MSVAYDWRRQDGRRGGLARSKSLHPSRISKRSLAVGAALYPVTVQAEYERPRTVGDCERQGLGRVHACPWVTCKHHLYLDVDPRTGAIRIAYPELEVHQLPETCALVVADRGESTLEQIGALTNVVRERVRQITDAATAKLRRHLPLYDELASVERDQDGAL